MTITGCEFNGMTFSVSGLGYIPDGEILNEQGEPPGYHKIPRNSGGDISLFPARQAAGFWERELVVFVVHI